MAKLIFYVLYVFNSLTLLFYAGTLFFNLTSNKAFTKSSENVIFALAIVVLAIGIYLAHYRAYSQHNFTIANIIFAVSWVIAFVIIIIGLLFFNGPLHW
jgi:hypothetical protein